MSVASDSHDRPGLPMGGEDAFLPGSGRHISFRTRPQAVSYTLGPARASEAPCSLPRRCCESLPRVPTELSTSRRSDGTVGPAATQPPTPTVRLLPAVSGTVTPPAYNDRTTAFGAFTLPLVMDRASMVVENLMRSPNPMPSCT
jgi:hypothetical protein